jgi:uncharacterized OB-fold protein
MIADWTSGQPGICYYACGKCRNVWYFRRVFCVACGAADPELRQASGRGVVAAVTVVTRAPTAELKAYAPYGLALVDAEEGFRLMAQGDQDLSIGDRVQASFKQFGDRIVPHFEKAP